MPTDPEHEWIPEPSVGFKYPEIPLVELLRDYCRLHYGRDILPADSKWLADFVGRFLFWSEISPKRHELRIAGEKLIRVLVAIDQVMACSKNLERDWRQVALALALPSARYSEDTESQIGCSFGVTKMCISKSISKLLRLCELTPHSKGFNGRQLVH
jgi:hypothetical protein